MSDQPPVVFVQDEADPKAVYIVLKAEGLTMIKLPQFGDGQYVGRQLTRTDLCDTAYHALVAAGVNVPDQVQGD